MQPIAYVNGRYLASDELRLPVSDSGFILGVTIAEQLRTFGGRSFHVSAHLQRLRRGLQTVGIPEVIDRVDFVAILEHVVGHNRDLIDSADDLGITLFVTPGPYPTYAPTTTPEPTVAVHTYPLPFRLWSEKYLSGQSLRIVDVQQVSPRSWPPAIKCRSRMHYYLADRQARAQDPQATAVLLDESGCVSETPIANLVACFAGVGLVSPPREKILPGITLQVTEELARSAGLPFEYRDLQVEDLLSADEILLTSTPYCLLAATHINSQPVGTGEPGPIYQMLLREWSEMVGFDLVEQASRFANR